MGWTKGNIIILDGITSIDSEILGIMSAHEMIHCMGLDKQQYTKDDDNCTVENCLMNKDPSKSEGKLCGYCESGLKGYLDGLREASKAKNSKE